MLAGLRVFGLWPLICELAAVLVARAILPAPRSTVLDLSCLSNVYVRPLKVDASC